MRSSLIALTAAFGLAGGAALAQTPQATPQAAKPSPAATTKLSDQQCTAEWQKALGSSGAQSLTEATSHGYLSNFKAADTNNDSKVDQSEWKAACKKGLVVASASGSTVEKNKTGEHPPTNRMDKMVPPMTGPK